MLLRRLAAPNGRSGLSASWPIAIALAAVGLVWIAIHARGIGLSIDAITYLSVARNLVAGDGFVDCVREPFAHWGPLFPAVLALFGAIGVDPLQAAPWINALCFGGAVWIAAEWLRRNVESAPLALVASVLCLAAAPVFQTSIFAFSEPLYTLLSLAALLALARHLRTGERVPFVFAAIAAGLCFATRYIGCSAVAAGVLVLLVEPRVEVRRRWGRAIVFGGVASLPMMVWIARNKLVTGTWTGGRQPAHATLWEGVRSMLTGVADWLGAGASSGAWLGGALALLAIGAFATLARRALRERFDTFAPPCAYLALYLVILVSISMFGEAVVMPGRLMAPAYIPFVLVITQTADAAIPRVAPTTLRRIGSMAMLVALGVWCAVQIVRIQSTVVLAQTRGLPFTEARWSSIHILDHLRQHPPSGRVWSNDPWIVYQFTGIQAELSPRPFRPFMPREQDRGLTALRSIVERGGDCGLVWLPFVHHEWMHELDEVRAVVECVPTAEFPDGTLYRLRRLEQDR